MNSYRLTFKYDRDGIMVNVELVGGPRIIADGLEYAQLAIGGHLQKLANVATSDPALMGELGLLMTIRNGAVFPEYEGEYLRIEAIGESTQIVVSVEWNDK